eukprot:357381-Chlamydomonas_euryale.AAC.4
MHAAAAPHLKSFSPNTPVSSCCAAVSHSNVPACQSARGASCSCCSACSTASRRLRRSCCRRRSCDTCASVCRVEAARGRSARRLGLHRHAMSAGAAAETPAPPAERNQGGSEWAHV